VWKDYGPYEQGEYYTWDPPGDSIIFDEDWMGTEFVVDSFEDCTGLRVRARLDLPEEDCPDVSDTCTTYVEGTRNG
jgi:hypothetical protein